MRSFVVAIFFRLRTFSLKLGDASKEGCCCRAPIAREERYEWLLELFAHPSSPDAAMILDVLPPDAPAIAMQPTMSSINSKLDRTSLSLA